MHLPPPVPHESISNKCSIFASLTSVLNTASAAGLLHMFPRQTKFTPTFPAEFCDDDDDEDEDEDEDEATTDMNRPSSRSFRKEEEEEEEEHSSDPRAGLLLLLFGLVFVSREEHRGVTTLLHSRRRKIKMLC